MVAQKSALLRLPPELRNRIYDYVYPRPSVGDCATSRSDPVILMAIIDQPKLHTNKTFRRHIACTQTCRQLRDETHLLPYIGRNFLIKIVAPVSYGIWSPLELPTHEVFWSKVWRRSPAMTAIAKYLEVLGPAAVSLMGTLRVTEGNRTPGRGSYVRMKQSTSGAKVLQIQFDNDEALVFGHDGASLPTLRAMREKFGGCVEVFEAAGFVTEFYFGPKKILQ